MTSGGSAVTAQSVARYDQASQADTATVLAGLGASEEGLTEREVERSRERYGANLIKHEDQDSLGKRIVGAFINPFTVVLIVLAAMSIVTDIILPTTQGRLADRDPLTSIIILSMVAISGVMRFVQESRSAIAVAKLTAMIATNATVVRQPIGAEEVDLTQLVVGDIIQLSAGDMIPADIRIIGAKDLFVNQSSLTGESEPQERTGDAVPGGAPPIERHNLAFMGSNVISGTATAVVLAVGDETMFGDIAKSVAGQSTQTSFEKGVNSVSWVLIRFMLVMVPVVFFANGITTGNWMESLLFGLAVAVGLTPEMLPMIVTACLSKGAVAMSKKQAIIKNLNAMQNFGAIDILCTDKTGTITQDEVALTYFMDVYGREDFRVLRHGFLNSYFQTGLKNLLDVAIIDKTHEEEGQDERLQGLADNYVKVDEIPFDFARRRMSVVVESQYSGKTQMITKGAVEEMLEVCAFAEFQERVEPLTEELKDQIRRTVADFNDDGLRVLAVAHKHDPAPVGTFGAADETNMVLLGYLAFLDPPKQDATEAIQALAEYHVTTKILTGDNEKVTRAICKRVGLDVTNILLGSEVEALSDEELGATALTTNVFGRLSPMQKARIVTVLRGAGHTVGFLGDGINDAAAMRAADIGISVDTAVDIAKESADIILLKKDLMVLKDGLIEGRKTYANMIKYIKMTASSNFGNMFSVVIAAALLPFVPMLPVQIIFLNLIYDISCIAIPWDNVDKEYLRQPRRWDASSVSSFMIWLGPISSVFDLTTYALLYFYLIPKFVTGGIPFHAIDPAQIVETGMFAGLNMRFAFIALFHAGWFVESMWSQTLVIHMIRTPKIPFLQSHASWQLTALTTAGIVALTIVPFTGFGRSIGLIPLPGEYFWWLALTIVAYMVLAQVLKHVYIRRHGELL
ncbi:MAG: magnesium-translocating P-type ATPase [Promicromonosporaceae bacterium]|nr:magnesium-translocating P-type ATPase [Promicromonosporaceae bacterium]